MSKRIVGARFIAPPAAETAQPDFTVHQLNVFRTVAHHLSYTKAAEALYLSQPAVSQQIKTLERLLGLHLFERLGRGIVLTSAGQEFLEHTERLLALLAGTAPVVQAIHELKRGSVLIGASTSAGTYTVPPLLGVFHTRFPGIHVTLVVANRHSIEEDLLARRIDLAVMSLIERQDRFDVEFLMPYELVVVAPPSHRLAGCPSFDPHNLQQETWLLREQGSGTMHDTEQHLVHAGVPLQTSLELGSIEAIKEGVTAGLGIAVLSHESVALEVASGDLAILNVQGFPLRRQWHIVHVKGRRLSLAATALRQFLLESRTAAQ